MLWFICWVFTWFRGLIWTHWVKLISDYCFSEVNIVVKSIYYLSNIIEYISFDTLIPVSVICMHFLQISHEIGQQMSQSDSEKECSITSLGAFYRHSKRVVSEISGSENVVVLFMMQSLSPSVCVRDRGLGSTHRANNKRRKKRGSPGQRRQYLSWQCLRL